MIFLSTQESWTLSLLMLDYLVDADQEKAAVLGGASLSCRFLPFF